MFRSCKILGLAVFTFSYGWLGHSVGNSKAKVLQSIVQALAFSCFGLEVILDLTEGQRLFVLALACLE